MTSIISTFPLCSETTKSDFFLREKEYKRTKYNETTS